MFKWLVYGKHQIQYPKCALEINVSSITPHGVDMVLTYTIGTRGVILIDCWQVGYVF